MPTKNSTKIQESSNDTFLDELREMFGGLFGKKILLLISSLYLVFLWWYVSSDQDCLRSTVCRHYLWHIKIAWAIGTPLIGVFIVILITFWMDERIFKIWRLFAFFAVPYTSYLMYKSLFVPRAHGLGIEGGDFSGVGAAILDLKFIGISAVVIIISWFILKRYPLQKKSTVKMKR